MLTTEPLSATQIAQYQDDGYLIVSDLLTAEEVAAFREHAGQTSPATYGLHGHLQDPQYRYLVTHPKIVGIVEQLVGGRLGVVQTMLLDKPVSGGKGIPLHQDSHYLPNEPMTLTACWIAMTDTDPENGGLAVVPGSHKTGLRSWHRSQNTEEHGTEYEEEHLMRDSEGKEWKQTMLSFEIDELDPASIKRLTVPKGSAGLFTGLTIHGSFANKTLDRPRVAFAIHYANQNTWLFRCDVQEMMAV